MTKNVQGKNHPQGAWAKAGRTPQGVFGVVVGHDEMRIGFIPEAAIEAWLAAALKVDSDALIPLDAAAELDAFKADWALREKRGAAAGNN